MRSLRYVQGPADRCWPWTGHIDANGYGKTGTGWAHRDVYEELVGPVPAGLHLDHLCRMRSCVNPAHLEPITQAENNRRAMTLRMAEGRKCGHPYEPGQDCRECTRVRAACFRAKLAAGQATIRTIICTECDQVKPNCAKGMCRRCYTRLYKRAVSQPVVPAST